MARILPLLLALPICGVAFLNSVQKGTPRVSQSNRIPLLSPREISLTKHRQARRSHLRWLPTSPGSPLHQFSSPFNPKPSSSNGKSNQNSDRNPKAVNGDSNRTSPHLDNDDHSNTTTNADTATAVNGSKDHETEKRKSDSVLFGKHQHSNLHHNASSPLNITSDGNATTTSNTTAKNQTASTTKSYYGNLLETYFPFLQSPTSPNTPLRFRSAPTKYPPRKSSTSSTTSHNVVNDFSKNSLAVLQDRDANDTITVSDLRSILAQAAVAQQQQQQQQSSSSAPYGSSSNHYDASSSSTSDPSVQIAPNGAASTTAVATAGSSTKRPSQVAFPQPSILSYRDVQRGTTFAGGVLGLILGTTILPNLWLVGMLLGAMYGYEITKEPAVDPETGEREPLQEHNMIGKRLISLGRRIAQTFLNAYDHWKTLWFLYKTGQLSYEYYKRYEMLDQRFEIQDKVDAWNRRFAEGKKRFDAWEQENEVGRTILAGLRTVWLVDEQSKRRAREKSRYRLVQILYDAKFYVKYWLRKVKMWAKSFFKEGGIQTLIESLRDDLTNGDPASARVGAAIVAVALVNIGGALFSISPVFSNLLAIVTAVLWPSGALDLLSRIRSPASERISRDSKSTSLSTPNFLKRYDRNKYNYFTRPDGTRRYYRTGQSMVSANTKKKGKSDSSTSNSFSNMFWNPAAGNAKNTEPNAWWGFRQKPTR